MTMHPKEILTLADLAERWGVCTETVMRRIEDPAQPLAAIAIGRAGDPARRRLTLRFRLETVRAWERDRERVLAPEAPAQEPAGRPPGYDGPIYTGRGKKGRARRA